MAVLEHPEAAAVALVLEDDRRSGVVCGVVSRGALVGRSGPGSGGRPSTGVAVRRS